VSCFICLINPLEGLLVRSYYSVCTSCVSFVNAFRHCTVLQRTAFLLPHATAAAKPRIEPSRADSFASCTLSFSS